MISARSSLDPWKRSTRSTGHHLRNSLHQLASCWVLVVRIEGTRGAGYNAIGEREAHAGTHRRLGHEDEVGPVDIEELVVVGQHRDGLQRLACGVDGWWIIVVVECM